MKKNIKRVLAIAMVILLLSLYVWSFVAALLARPEAGRMFFAAVFTTIFFPILIWVYMWVAQLLRGKGVPKTDDVKSDKKDNN